MKAEYPKRVVPVSGGTVSVFLQNEYVLLDPPGLLLALTIKTPPDAEDGQIVMFNATKAITLITWDFGVSSIWGPNGGEGMPTTLLPNDPFSLVFLEETKKWYRIHG